ncbi:ATP-dependent helicase HrpB [Rhodosalinus sediminis]|uniref:RNA helicase n=1 Tax=Rhodosalinus sediminis TaxID=1940533 RepID=A0A3D9BRA3_9RHOB|nr:ATP-dependent helicase HrpB [Rhodosalinus sediminis]REC55906.1 ATP-dependent helicase HrpB [Rhodosalinus sediminis]
MAQPLPIDAALPELLDALRARRRAVLEAPPGAGKTTRVPLALDAAGLAQGRIVMLEPRRIAARAAAERMAEALGERPGDSVGYRIRGESVVSAATRIEVVTEGVLTRMIQSDPELSGVGAVIFDEIHERSLNADLGLALCLEIAGALREDLILLAMSATLETAALADLMAAPVVRAEGRSFPVETRWLDRPLGRGARLEAATADLVARAIAETEGGVLVFLPGEGEIRRTAAALEGRLPAGCVIRPLYGALPLAAQRAAIRPERDARKVVLSTSVAETSLTIEDIRVVVDAGRARRSRFDPGAGMARLVTERVTRAEAAQRAGRAGRVAPGVAYRLWSKGEEGALAAHPPAEIEAADLAGLALELALWGAAHEALPFPTPPPPAAYAEAVALLQTLGALDARGGVTAHGRRLAALPLHPRLGHMLTRAGAQAAPLAALMADRDPLPRAAPVDLSLRLEALRDPARFTEERPWAPNRGAVERLRAEAARLEKAAPEGDTLGPLSPGAMAALAYPDRIGLRRKGEAPRYLLSGGKGAALPEDDPLAGARLIVASDLDGDRREARVRRAAAVTEGELRALFPERIGWVEVCRWSRRARRVVARRQERLGAIALDDRIWREVPADRVAGAMLEGVRDLGLAPSAAVRRLQARVALGRAAGLDLPDLSDAALMETLEDWLLPFLSGVRSAEDWAQFDLSHALRARLGPMGERALDRAVPGAFETPLGRRVPIDYTGEAPEISVRLQEMFGRTAHPQVGGRPLRITLLSPAGRPVQTTTDLPGFWAGAYAEVRKEMRGRYPKHPWPEDPTEAAPTLRTKRKGG